MIKRAMEIFEKLTEQKPEVFNPDRALALNIFSLITRRDNLQKALESAGEAVKMLLPFYNKHDDIYRPWMSKMAADYKYLCDVHRKRPSHDIARLIKRLY